MSLLAGHTRLARAVFRFKVRALQLRRGVHNAVHPLVRHRASPDTLPHLLAESITPLWTSEALAEKRLQLGKVQNLRLAARTIHGLQLPAGGIFSFWRQVGRASAYRGFVAGRELREGCLIPSVGGGLCQLSNALYEAALTAACPILERHPHSQPVPGSAAALGRDATVFWNYLDLRFAAPAPLRIDVQLTADDLVVRFWSDRAAVPVALPRLRRIPLLTPVPRGCDACGEVACEQHSLPAAVAARQPLPRETVTAYVLEEAWPEHAAWVQAEKRPHDRLLIPFVRRGRPGWEQTGFAHVSRARLPVVVRALAARRATTPAQRRAAQLAGSACVARALGRRIPVEATHVVVSQTLLPFLWEQGWLGGRTFDVLLTRLPLAQLHATLDTALARRPGARLLGDFRAPDSLVRDEQAALAAARQLLTPHAAIAALLPEKTRRLSWALPAPLDPSPTTVPPLTPGTRVIAFAGPTAARKGAYAVRDAARALDLTVHLRGSVLEGPGFWAGLRTKHTQSLHDWLEGVSCVVQPAVVEDAPRALLHALAAGIPVLASPACGLKGLPGVTTVAPDDTEALMTTLRWVLAPRGTLLEPAR